MCGDCVDASYRTTNRNRTAGVASGCGPEWIVTAFGVCLLIWQWGAARPLWLDEQMIALNFRDRTFWDLSHPLSFDQSAPFGWLLLERIALLGLGANELALRLAPALFGIATLLCALLIGQRWMSPVGATAFALLCSFGQWLSFYAVELKHYSADAFGGLLLPALTVWVAEADANESASASPFGALWSPWLTGSRSARCWSRPCVLRCWRSC